MGLITNLVKRNCFYIYQDFVNDLTTWKKRYRQVIMDLCGRTTYANTLEHGNKIVRVG